MDAVSTRFRLIVTALIRWLLVAYLDLYVTVWCQALIWWARPIFRIITGLRLRDFQTHLLAHVVVRNRALNILTILEFALCCRDQIRITELLMANLIGAWLLRPGHLLQGELRGFFSAHPILLRLHIRRLLRLDVHDPILPIILTIGLIRVIGRRYNFHIVLGSCLLLVRLAWRPVVLLRVTPLVQIYLLRELCVQLLMPRHLAEVITA